MKQSTCQDLIAVFLVVFVFVFVAIQNCEAKIATDKNKKPATKAHCSSTGTLSCPNGFKPSCPKSHQPACVLLGTQQPACLADNVDGSVFSYDLKNIGCEKKKK